MWERGLRLKEKLRRGEAVHGAWISLPDPVVSEVFAGAGFDYVLFEAEHSPFDLQALQACLMAFNGTETVPMIRVPWNDHVRIKQALDMGVEGIMAPMVNSVAEAEALVAACKYPPTGRRGFGPRRGSRYYRQIDGYVAQANDGVFVMPQIESVRTVEEIEAFCSVPGIDAIAIGPNDLSGSAGLLRQTSHPTVQAALDKIMATAKAHGLPVCLGISTPVERQAELIAKGVRFLIVTSDLELLIRGMDRELKAAREALAGG